MHANPAPLVRRYVADISVPSGRSAAQAPTAADDLLELHVLATEKERIAIAALRRYAPMGVEDDLGAGLMPFEGVRDDIGFVVAIRRGTDLIATMRFVPSGHQLTAAERVLERTDALPVVWGPNNWEVGRLIVAPEARSPELLQRCLGLALGALIEARRVEHFFAIATPVMARLWRRFGMRPATRLVGASGREFALVAGHVTAVADALDVPLDMSQHAKRTSRLLAAKPSMVW